MKLNKEKFKKKILKANFLQSSDSKTDSSLPNSNNGSQGNEEEKFLPRNLYSQTYFQRFIELALSKDSLKGYPSSRRKVISEETPVT